jgi:hypothetical protein
MPTLRRTVAILTFPAIAYLGAACERTDTPTEVRPLAGVLQLSSSNTHWVNDDDPNGGFYVPPGTSCNDPGYPKIQDAVNAASSGDIIQVCAGTYQELPLGSPLTISKTLTLLGAQSTQDARSPRGAESIITDPQGTFVTANNVVIDVFTIQNSVIGAFTGYGIDMGAGTTGTQILNNIIQNNIIGIGLANTGGSQVLIRHNLIQNNNQPGPSSGTGIYTDEFVAGGAASNFLVEENKFVGNNDAGIDVSHTAFSVSNLEVAKNEFDMNGRAIFIINTDMSSFHDNTVTNSTLQSADVRIFGGVDNLKVLNNNLTLGAGHGIRLSAFIGGPNSGVVIHENNIEVYVLTGLTVDPGSHTGTVDAECNWWNSPSGPFNATSNPTGTGEEVVGDADFTPWLIAPAPGGACSGGVPSGKVTGGGQVPASGGKATFGFNAKNQAGVGSSGHLNYLNHVTGAHLDCTVTMVTMLTPTTAEFSGTCSPNSAAASFTAHVEDNGTPGKNGDVFRITYPNSMIGVTEGGPLISGNIVIHR